LSKNKRRELRKVESKEVEVKDKGVIVQAKTSGQKKYIIEILNHVITFCIGPAGSGKTAIAVGVALQSILSKNSIFDKLVVMRPAKEACGEKIGFLPGDLEEKMGPWASPIVDNMQIWLEVPIIKKLFYDKKVEVIPLAYARGRSLNKSFIIVDEAQNCSPEQMLMALTRIGNDSKMVINGDLTQTDVTNMVNGLEDAIERMNDMDNVSIVTLDETDIVRNPIIGEIIKRYADHSPVSHQ
jgi:phosphate starvation-inducible PhoH-like protein